MIAISLNVETGTATLTGTASVTVGQPCVVEVTFTNGAPADVAIQLAIGKPLLFPDSVLAFLDIDDFTVDDEDDTVYHATLDGTDIRLARFMAARIREVIQLGIIGEVDGKPIATPHVDIDVQMGIISGDPNSQPGPNYLTDAQTRTLLNRRSSVAEVLGVNDNAVDTVPVTNLQNTGEGTYGGTQCFGSTFWNPVKGLWFTTINTGASSYLMYSEDGIFWSDLILIGQDPLGYICLAAGCDSNGVVWAIVTGGPLNGIDTYNTIKKTTTNGERWTDIPLTEFVPYSVIGPITQIGDGRMVASYWLTGPESGLLFFDPADPTDVSHINLAPDITTETEITLCYDADNEVLVGLARTDSAVIPVKMVTLEAPWDDPIVTPLTDGTVPPAPGVVPAVLLNGSQISVACLGTNFIASATLRTPGDEYLLIADRTEALSDPANAWTLYHVGKTAAATSSINHNVNGSGGLASNLTDKLIHMCGVGFGDDRHRDAELICTVYDLSPDIENPLMKAGDAARLRRTGLPRRVIVDNPDNPANTYKLTIAANCHYTCLGRAVIALSSYARRGEPTIVTKSDDELVVVNYQSTTGPEYRSVPWARSAGTITVTLENHGRTNGEQVKVVAVLGADAPPADTVYTVGGATDDTFTFAEAGADGSGTLTYQLYKAQTIHWTDGATYNTASQSLLDVSGRKRTYTFTCLGPQEFLAECHQAEIETLASPEAFTIDPTYIGNIMSLRDAISSRNMFRERDDFAGSGSASGSIGELRWNIASGTVDVNDGVAGHPGIVKLISGAADGNVGLLTNLNQDYYFVRSLVPLHGEWIFRLPSVAEICLFLGWENNAGTYPAGGGAVTDGVHSFGLKLDTGAGSNPTHFKSVTKLTGGDITETSLGVAVAGLDWYRFEVTESLVGTMVFTLTHLAGDPRPVTTATHTTNLPTDALYRAARVGTKVLAGASKEVWLDSYRLALLNLNR